MAADLNRRGFLRGKREALKPGLGLPWTTFSSIENKCSRCMKCLEACPEKIISIGDGGFPVMDFKLGECSFCGDCAKICPEQVFDLEQDPVMNLALSLDLDKCLPEQGVYCESCRDSCPENAIKMTMRIGKPPLPQIDEDKCTHCGACFQPCPTHALEFSYQDLSKARKEELAHV